MIKFRVLAMLLFFNFNLYSARIWDLERIKRGRVMGVSMRNAQRVPRSQLICGDAFRAICNHIFDETDVLFDPIKVMEGDTVFVKTDFLDLFFKYVHGQIKQRYILVTHNSDDSCPGEYKSFLEDPKIIAWFGMDPDIKHSKLIPIPIGFANAHWPCGDTKKIMETLNLTNPKEHLLIINFRNGTNLAERMPVYNQFKDQPYCYKPNLDKPFEKYLLDMKISRFCLSPFGNGKDSHRVWEAVAMGCIPIVKSSILDQLYQQAPVVIVDNWEMVNQEFLEKKYQELSAKNSGGSIITINYWQDKINQVKNNLIIK